MVKGPQRVSLRGFLVWVQHHSGLVMQLWALQLHKVRLTPKSSVRGNFFLQMKANCGQNHLPHSHGSSIWSRGGAQNSAGRLAAGSALNLEINFHRFVVWGSSRVPPAVFATVSFSRSWRRGLVSILVIYALESLLIESPAPWVWIPTDPGSQCHDNNAIRAHNGCLVHYPDTSLFTDVWAMNF